MPAPCSWKTAENMNPTVYLQQEHEILYRVLAIFFSQPDRIYSSLFILNMWSHTECQTSSLSLRDHNVVIQTKPAWVECLIAALKARHVCQKSTYFYSSKQQRRQSWLPSGERWGTPWTSGQLIAGLTYRNKCTLTSTAKDNLASPVRLSSARLWTLVEEGEVSWESPGGLTVLTTSPPCTAQHWTNV